MSKPIQTTCPGVRLCLLLFRKGWHVFIGGRCAQKRRTHYNQLVIRRDIAPWAGCTWRSPGGPAPEAASLGGCMTGFYAYRARVGRYSEKGRVRAPHSQLRNPNTRCQDNFSGDCCAGEPGWILARCHPVEAGAHLFSVPCKPRGAG